VQELPREGRVQDGEVSAVQLRNPPGAGMGAEDKETLRKGVMHFPLEAVRLWAG
jgi:hypothetical protein